MSSSCGKRNGEKGRKQKTYLSRNVGMALWEDGEDGRLLLLKGLRLEIQLWSASILASLLFLDLGRSLVLLELLRLLVLLKIIKIDFENSTDLKGGQESMFGKS